jgi:hypothetical protein
MEVIGAELEETERLRLLGLAWVEGRWTGVNVVSFREENSWNKVVLGSGETHPKTHSVFL